VPPVCCGPKRLETSCPLSRESELQKFWFVGINSSEGYYINPDLLEAV